MNKVLITGVNGFVGEHVARSLQEAGYSTVGIARQDKPNEKLDGLLDEYLQTDLSNEKDVSLISLQGVRAIIHLAGLADVGKSFDSPQLYLRENPAMTYNLHEQANREGFHGRIVNVSTGALYSPNQQLPLSEHSLTSPTSPYALSKLGAEEVSHYWASRGLDSVVARPFNHIGPGQGRGFLVPDLYAQLTDTNGIVRVGNIETRRDYTDVRDIARAYRDLALADSLGHDTYNVSSGRSLSGKSILDLLIKASDHQGINVEVDASKIRPNDVMDIYGDSSRLTHELGWSPSYPIEQTLTDFVEAKRAEK